MNKEEKVKVFDKEIGYIKNPHLQENIKILIGLLPNYFFKVAASSTGKYHPSFACGEGGLVRHTKVAVQIANELYNDDSLMESYTNDEKDLMIMALLIHDGLKLGLEESEFTKFDHPLIMSNFITDNKKLLTLKDEEIQFLKDVIETHMGPWNTNIYSNVVLPKPKTKYQRFVHLCDYLSSKKMFDVKFEDNNIKVWEELMKDSNLNDKKEN